MDILTIPFHKFLNIKKHAGNKYIFEADERPEHLNHLQTIHACAQLALAEASSGEFLLQQFWEINKDVIPLIRKTEVKYHKPANGTLYSRASFRSANRAEVLDELTNKNRVITQIKVEILDSSENKVLTAIFDWFLQIK